MRPRSGPPASAPDEQLLIGIAMQALRQGDLAGAGHWIAQLLQHHPRHAEGHTLAGVVAAQRGDFAQAAASFSRSLELRPQQPNVQNNCGVALRRLGREAEAEARFREAIAQQPAYAEAHFNLANLLRDARRHEEALASYAQALALQPAFAPAHNGRGAALADLKRHAEALPCFDAALALQPALADAHANRAGALAALGRAEEAVAAADQALGLQPAHADALVHRGNALARLRRGAEALACYEAALRLDARKAAAHVGRGAALLEANRFEDAIAALDQALAIDPDDVEALDNRAQAAGRLRRHDEAAAAFERLLALDPDYPAAAGNLLHARMLGCDWRDFDALAARVHEGLQAGRLVAEPFGLQGFATSEDDLRRCAELFAAREYPATPLPAPPRRATPGGRVTIGYVCGEFRQHATTILLAGVFERHDKSRFRTIAFDNGGGDGSEYRRRVEAAFDEVVDIRRLGDREVALLARERGVDILVNLNGWYGEGRMGVFAHRPCTIQVNYLGFPGTLGAPYFDYLLADEVVLPAASFPHYVEQVAWLPHCYQANDDRRPVAAATPRRADHGLPDEAFVYCCFNNNYKLTPATFDGWMRILARVPGSVLWLLEDNPAVPPRLRAEAQARGIAPERLVFAPRLAPADHLARHVLADLFLDTLPYNAHTTASDALWAGLPLLTCTGTTFPGRVAASLLRALDLPELVTQDPASYEQAAIGLATDPDRLQSLRARLSERRAAAPLFDTGRFTTHLERLFDAMIERDARGLAAAHLQLAD